MSRQLVLGKFRTSWRCTRPRSIVRPFAVEMWGRFVAVLAMSLWKDAIGPAMVRSFSRTVAQACVRATLPCEDLTAAEHSDRTLEPCTRVAA